MNDFPRRNDFNQLKPLEKRLYDASIAIEEAGAHPLLTEVGQKLLEARNILADYYERLLPCQTENDC